MVYMCKDCRKVSTMMLLRCPYCNSSRYGYVSDMRHKDLISGKDGVVQKDE